MSCIYVYVVVALWKEVIALHKMNSESADHRLAVDLQESRIYLRDVYLKVSIHM